MPAPSSQIAALWVTLCIGFGLLVAIAAGLLAGAAGQALPAAILTGGGAFGGTVLLTLMIKRALVPDPSASTPPEGAPRATEEPSDHHLHARNREMALPAINFGVVVLAAAAAAFAAYNRTHRND
jgi:hypothetical protein